MPLTKPGTATFFTRVVVDAPREDDTVDKARVPEILYNRSQKRERRRRWSETEWYRPPKNQGKIEEVSEEVSTKKGLVQPVHGMAWHETR